MEDVGAVLMDQHTGIIQPVIGVAAHMGAALHHQNGFSLFGQSPGTHGAGVSGAYDQCVKFMLQGHSTFPKLRDGPSIPYFSPKENEKTLKFPLRPSFSPASGEL